jgi:membrane-bound inhibitor of C-type lysozyme
MRHLVISIALSAFALALGCSKSEEAKAPAAAETAEPVAAAPEAAPGPAPMPAANNGFDYACADGVSFNAKIDKGNALVTIDGKTATLAPVEGAFSAQYAGEGLTFIARGDEAMLVRDGKAPQDCKAKPS